MTYLENIPIILNSVFGISNTDSRTKFDYSCILGFDVRRVQISVLILGNLILALDMHKFHFLWNYVVFGFLPLVFIYQFVLIIPDKATTPKQIIKYECGKNEDTGVSSVSNGRRKKSINRFQRLNSITETSKNLS